MRRIKSLIIRRGILLPAAFFILGGGLATTTINCASNQVAQSDSAEAAFKSAEDFEKDERYEEALQKFNEVKNKHPYSKYAVEAELRVADIHYKQESYIEAATAYQLFKDFHPRNPKIDYVTYRLAMSYYMQLPPTADRDLSPSMKALQYFTEVINGYPTSQYVKDSQDKKLEILKMLAEKEAYVGEFYYIRDKYDSAQHRYEGLLLKYPNLGFDEKALYFAGMSAFKDGDKDAGAKHMNELLTRFPNGSYASKAKDALEKYANR